MKQTINIIIFLIIALHNLVCYAEKPEPIITYGDLIVLQPGTYGKLWHPSARLVRMDTNETENTTYNLISILLTDDKSYYDMPEEGKLLLKFEDNSISELNSHGEMQKESGVILGRTVYCSGRDFILNSSDLEKLLTMPITKIRIELDKGFRCDYEVNAKHGKKMLKKFKDSYNKIYKIQEKRLHNLNSDIKEGF